MARQMLLESAGRAIMRAQRWIPICLFAMTACARSCGTSDKSAPAVPTPVTIRLEEEPVPVDGKPAPMSFSRMYDRDCPRIAKRVLACATDPKFAPALMVYIGADSKRVVKAEI